MSVTQSPTAGPGERVANTYELLESILIHVSCKDLLLFQRTSRSFKSIIERSQKLWEEKFEVRCPPANMTSLNHMPGPLPVLFERHTLYPSFARNYDGSHMYSLYITINDKQLSSDRWREDHTWRSLLILRPSTKSLTIEITGDTILYPGGLRAARPPTDSEDASTWHRTDYRSHPYRTVMATELKYHSAEGITLGDLADIAYELYDFGDWLPRIRFSANTDERGDVEDHGEDSCLSSDDDYYAVLDKARAATYDKVEDDPSFKRVEFEAGLLMRPGGDIYVTKKERAVALW